MPVQSMQNAERSADTTAAGIFLAPFNSRNRLGLEMGADGWRLPRRDFKTPLSAGAAMEEAAASLAVEAGLKGRCHFQFYKELRPEELPYGVAFLRVEDAPPSSLTFFSLESLTAMAEDEPERFPNWFPELLGKIREFSIEIPYLDFRSHDFVYKFRSNRERNTGIYQPDASSRALYQSRLCEAIKATRRAKENRSAPPALLDFGPVQYYLPSHFGFCLGVQNAIERAYETLAEHPDQRVFMLSELIHNPFVNRDLRSRGLLFLQTDKGVPIQEPETGDPYWDHLCEEDIVVIPAFGATLEDKRRLIEKGLEINRYDATCMLVEKVWKAAKRYGEDGYTVVIHGKGEHEETKATFSNSARYAPCVIIRNHEDAERICAIIRTPDPEAKRRMFQKAHLRATPGFDPVVDLEKIAVVNQTTLLRNETLKIIRTFEEVMDAVHGTGSAAERVNGKGRGDTLCYATQVNQDALSRALDESIDLALVAGGENSSNTYQLYRICRERFGERAHYIQSERNIESASAVRHFHFPYDPDDPRGGKLETRPFLDAVEKPAGEPVRILLTGGASCPDGIIQQIITRVNGFYDPGTLRSIDSVLEAIEGR